MPRRSPVAKATLASCVLLMLPELALAAGTTSNEISATGSAVQGAVTAAPEDASTLFYNPAGLTEIEGTRFEIHPVLALPNVEYERPSVGASENERSIAAASLFATTDAVGGVHLGLGLYAPFAREAKFSNEPAFLGQSHRSRLVRADLVPTVAFEIAEGVSIGLSAVASHITVQTDVLGLDESARGYGFTANAGMLVDIPGDVRLGVSYRAAMAARLEGHGTFAGQRGDFGAKLRFPAVLSTGVAWQVNQKLSLQLTYDREYWSYVDGFRRNYSNATLKAVGNTALDASDSGTVRIGARYTPAPGHELRVGFSRVGSAFGSQTTLPSQIDLDYRGVAIGYTRKLGRFDVSLTYEHLRSEERTTQNSFFPGNYELRAHVLQLGFAYRWQGD